MPLSTLFSYLEIDELTTRGDGFGGGGWAKIFGPLLNKIPPLKNVVKKTCAILWLKGVDHVQSSTLMFGMEYGVTSWGNFFL